MTDRDVPPPLDELLARREWVRRFARTLARDDASADDLAQDAWVAAVERPPRHADAPTGWFRRVLVRRAIDVTRGARRRESRELAASRTDASPSTADVVAAAESHRRVVEAVMALDEPYRATVLLRFFEDLPPREVAARMGLPVETVRSRVRRAVAMLRARLDEAHEGRRAAWLAPLLGAEGKTSSPTHVAPAVKGAIAMTTGKKVLITAALLLLIAGGAVVSLLPAAPRDDRVAADAPPPGGPKAGPRRRSRSRDEDRIPADTADSKTPVVDAPSPSAPPESTRDLEVLVVDTDRNPVAGVRVHLNVAGARRDSPIVATDADGRAHFSVAGVVKSAWVASETTDGGAVQPKRSPTPVPETGREVSIVVERREWIKGRVEDEHGKRISDAWVMAVRDGRAVWEGQSWTEGAFKLAVPPGGPYDLVLKEVHGVRPGTEEALVGEVRGVSPGGPDVVLIVRPATGALPLHVRVVTSDGRPLAGVPLVVTTPSMKKCFGMGSTDADGRFTCSDVADRDVRVDVEIKYGQRTPWPDGWIAPPWPGRLVRPGDAEVSLVFQAGRPIRGRVEFPADYAGDDALRRATGLAVPSAYVSAEDEQGVVSRVWSDQDARFTAWVPVTARGPFRVSFGMRTQAGRVFEGDVDGVLPGADDVVLRIVEKKN